MGREAGGPGGAQQKQRLTPHARVRTATVPWTAVFWGRLLPPGSQSPVALALRRGEPGEVAALPGQVRRRPRARHPHDHVQTRSRRRARLGLVV